MGKVNKCLKRSSIIVISLIAVLSALLLALTLFTHGHFSRDDEIDAFLPVLQVMYSKSFITLILAIIGAYGAYKEKKWALILFVVGMILGSLFFLISCIHGLAQRPKLPEELKGYYQQLLSQRNQSEIATDHFRSVQIDYQCCGLDQGYLDWGYNIPESCLCAEEPTKLCVAAPRNSSLFEHKIDDEPLMIYNESCLPYLIAQLMVPVDAMLVGFIGITLLWVSSVVLCIFILWRLGKNEDVPVVVYSSEAKAGNYTAFIDTAEQI